VDTTVAIVLVMITLRTWSNCWMYISKSERTILPWDP